MRRSPWAALAAVLGWFAASAAAALADGSRLAAAHVDGSPAGAPLAAFALGCAGAVAITLALAARRRPRRRADLGLYRPAPRAAAGALAAGAAVVGGAWALLGLATELVFRGFVLALLVRRLGRRPAIVLVVLVGAATGGQLGGLPGLLLAGAVLACGATCGALLLAGAAAPARRHAPAPPFVSLAAEEGATAIEYVGVLLVCAVCFAGLAASGRPGHVET
jgi:hypothetical protein